MELRSPISQIPRIGPAYVKRLNKIGIAAAQDLVFYFPNRYEDFSKIKKISQLKINEITCIKGEIQYIENQVTYRKRTSLTQAIIKDNTGTLQATWFNQPYLAETLQSGDKVCLAGRLVLGKNGLHLANPIYEKITSSKNQAGGLIHTGRIVPVYPETRGVSSRWLRYIIHPLLKQLSTKIIETLPQEIIQKHRLLPIQKAIWEIHFPSSSALLKNARTRFSFEELFLLELFVLSKKLEFSRQKAIGLPTQIETIQNFVKKLPFNLTDAQRKTSWQILKDTEKNSPMARLLQGDVGSGKTVVAAIAALNAAKAETQTAFMAPTEILSKQHFETLAQLLADFKINIGLLTSKTDKFVSKKLKRQAIEISRKKLLEKVLSGDIDILVGTHSLIQEKVKFCNLGLVIVDEQHRFGVNQRAQLCQKVTFQKKQAGVPHLLSMTATPIPRTLALTIYGDLDLSLIDEMPKGKRKVKTILVSAKERPKAYRLAEKEIKKGRQCFVICPRIEPADNLKPTMNDEGQKTRKNNSWSEVKAVKEEYEKLTKEIFPQFKVAMLHGKMPVTEKTKIMKDFKNQKFALLVSTSVIEVGIDIPNATIMLIEDAERFGLAQLHQFRGRIGRRGDRSYCLLFHNSGSKKSYARLKSLTTIENGLELAERDLKLRGPGQFLGSKQWGIPDLAMNALDNFALVEETRETAKEILSKDPKLKTFPHLKERLSRFKENIHLE
jgi:ATP-dependent DNA helicase RecG